MIRLITAVGPLATTISMGSQNRMDTRLRRILGQAQRIAAHDSGFQSFMLRHIDSTALTSELDRIAHSARHQCPRSATVLCKQIAGAAEAANSDAGPRE